MCARLCLLACACVRVDACDPLNVNAWVRVFVCVCCVCVCCLLRVQRRAVRPDAICSVVVCRAVLWCVALRCVVCCCVALCLHVGDVVLVHDASPIKGKYLLAIVDEVKGSKDGFVRSCVVRYRVPNPTAVVKATGKVEQRYPMGKEVKITRSVQRLTLLLPVEEQTGRLEVNDGLVLSED